MINDQHVKTQLLQRLKKFCWLGLNNLKFFKNWTAVEQTLADCFHSMESCQMHIFLSKLKHDKSAKIQTNWNAKFFVE